MEDRHLSLTEVAGLMGVSERTVRRWIKSGKLRAYKPGRDYRIPERAFREFVEESEVSPKGIAPPSLQRSFNGLLEEERRLRYLRGWRAFIHRLARLWEEKPPKTSAEIAPLFVAMTALVEEGVFETPEEASAADFTELVLVMEGFKRLNAIADKVEKEEEAQRRRATFAVIQEKLSA
jgi:excisionase family DNA binding protein